MKKSILGIMLVSLLALGLVSCGDGDDDGNGGGSGVWRWSKQITYTVAGGVAGSISSEIVPNWIRYTNDTNFEYSYTSGGQTVHVNRNGQTMVQTINTYPYTYLYDSASGLTLKTTITTATGTTETSYTVELQSDVGGVRTYKHYVTSTGGTGAYTVYKRQNGVTLEQSSYTADGTLSYTYTYTFPNNSVIRAKLPTFTLYSMNYPSQPTYNSYQTCEILSDSASALAIRIKTSTNNVLMSQYDYHYEKVR
jgi:hypothetical protein